MTNPENIKIFSAEWVLPITAEPIGNGALAIENDKIIDVGDSLVLQKKYPNATFEDFGEAAITPGFINCHSHLELSIMRGFLDDVEENFFKWLMKTAVTRDEKLTKEDIGISAIVGAIEGIRAGVTCFGDIGRYGVAGFSALKTTGLRGVIFQETEFSPDNENAEKDFTKLELKFAALKSKETNLVKVGISPHAPYTVSRKLFELIAAYSLAENIKISIHAAESKMEEDLMTRGSGSMAEFYQSRGIHWSAPNLSSIEYLAEIGVLESKPLLAHCILTNQKDWDLIKQSGSSIAHCPKSNAKFGHSIAPFESFLDNELRIGIGSDSVASNNSCDLLEEGRFASLLSRTRQEKKRLITAQDVLETMTIGGAKALHMEDEIGSLEAGKQADLVVISLKNIARQPVHDVYSSLIFAANSSDICLTMVAGKEIYRDGKVLTTDEDLLQAEIKQIAQKMQDL